MRERRFKVMEGPGGRFERRRRPRRSTEIADQMITLREEELERTRAALEDGSVDVLRDALERNRRALLRGRSLTRQFFTALQDELAQLR